MKVSFRQSGGYAGLTTGVDLDTADLSEEEARRLSELVDRADFDAVEAAAPANRRAADQFSYELVVETPAGTRRIAFTDAQKTEDVAMLLDFLRKRASPKPGF